MPSTSARSREPLQRTWHAAGRASPIGTPRATLAVAPAMPAPTGVNVPHLPENWDELDDAGKTNALDDFLQAFKAEHQRIVGEHETVMNQLTEQIKERKLQALRESLN